MNIKNTILDLVKSGKSFTHYDVLFLARKTHPKSTAKEVRKIASTLHNSNPKLKDYSRSQIRVDGEAATLYHPANVNSHSYEPSELTQWEECRRTDNDGRLSIPKNMLCRMPTNRPLGVTYGPDFLLIHKEGIPNTHFQIQKSRRDLRINPTQLKQVGIDGYTCKIKKTTEGILITR